MRITAAFGAIFLLILTCSSGVYPQKAVHVTVADLYLLLPTEYFPVPEQDRRQNISQRQYRESIIKIKDIKNGYLRVEPRGYEGWVEIAMFKQLRGKYVLGISGVYCDPGCSGEISFLQYVSGSELGWYNMTSTVLPEIGASRTRAALKRHGIPKAGTDLIYVLPRVGTTIKVQNAGDYFDAGFKPTVLFELNWTGSWFVLKDK